MRLKGNQIRKRNYRKPKTFQSEVCEVDELIHADLGGVETLSLGNAELIRKVLRDAILRSWEALLILKSDISQKCV